MSFLIDIFLRKINYLILICLLSIFPNIFNLSEASGQAQADTIVTVKNKFFYKNTKLKRIDLINLTKIYPETHEDLMNAELDLKFARITLLSGGLFILYPTGKAIYGKGPLWQYYIIGGGFIIASVISEYRYQFKIRSAINTFNNKVKAGQSKSMIKRNDLFFGKTNNGFGFTLKF
jgi:hypothetical protein